MILTYNIKHGRDFSKELVQAKKIAEFAIKTKSNSSKDVRHIGLKSAIANQILRKYRRKGIKKTSSVKLSIPGQSVKWNDRSKQATVPCIELELDCKYLPEFQNIRQIEIGKEIAHISVEITEPETKKANGFIGIDCNTTGHVAVVAIPYTGKIHKLGKSVSYCSLVLRTQNMSQLCKESDLCKGSTDTPQAAMSKMMITAEPTTL